MKDMRILVAEDNPFRESVLARAITRERSFLDVRVVNNGLTFAQAISRHHFDCIVLDFDLTDATAVELLLANGNHLRNCPIVAITGSAAQAQSLSAVENVSVSWMPRARAILTDALWRHIQDVLSTSSTVHTERRHEARDTESPQPGLTDLLTGLYNRYYFDWQLKSGFYRRDRRRNISCITIDIDHFTHVNDLYGRQRGDSTLREIAQLICDRLSGGDTPIRWSGEEFLILRSSAGVYEAWNWAETFRDSLAERTFRHGNREFRLTASMGVASFHTAHMGHRAIERTRDAMLLAKRRGRNQACTSDMLTVERALNHIEDDARLTVEQRWSRFIELCDGMLGPTQKQHLTEHCQEVSNLVAELSRPFAMSRTQRRRIRLAGLFHDLGKCLMPEELLSQPTPLTDQQWTVMGRHAELGAQISQRLSGDARLADFIRYHHVPYCDAFKGPIIPQGARLVTVADAISAMTTSRSYRRARSVQEAMTELKREAGRQFDPTIVTSVGSLDMFATPIA